MAGIQGFSQAPIEEPSGPKSHPVNMAFTYETHLPDMLSTAPSTTPNRIPGAPKYNLPANLDPLSAEGKIYISQVQMLCLAAVAQKLRERQ